MDKLEEFLKNNASKKPLVINETTLINQKLEKDFKRFEDRLRELKIKGKIDYKHETFPPESTNEQIVIKWLK